MSGVEGKVALVTGASRGIGRGIALALAQAGADVIGTSTSQAGADAVSAALAENGRAGSGVVLDVTAADQIEPMLTEIQKAHGDISILVNNAGITRDNLLMRMKEDEWDDIMSTNLKSVYRLSKGVLRGMMKARRGVAK